MHIEIPLDVITSEAGHLALAPHELPSRPAPAPESVARAANLLQRAERPLVVLGGGAVGAGGEALRLIERLDAPFVNTINAKGVMPPGHPLHAGENMAFAPLRQALREAEVVLAVGTEFGETEMYPEPQPLAFDGRLIRIDSDPEQLVRGFGAEVPTLGDARLALAALGTALGTKEGTETRADGPGARRAAEIRAAVRKLWWPAVAIHERALEAVQTSLPDLILVGDSTQPIYGANQFFRPAGDPGR